MNEKEEKQLLKSLAVDLREQAMPMAEKIAVMLVDQPVPVGLYALALVAMAAIESIARQEPDIVKKCQVMKQATRMLLNMIEAEGYTRQLNIVQDTVTELDPNQSQH